MTHFRRGRSLRMRQYGKVAGNDYDSERDMLSARAVENREASATIAEQVESAAPEAELLAEAECAAGRCEFCGPDPSDEYFWDAVVEGRVDNRPLTVTLVEAIR